jgi:myo-inositol-1(or 4)-monophosphatase
MRYSANLNIIIKAIEKASNHVARDFIELENLQANPISANKFASLTLSRVKQILVDEFTKFRENYDIIFSDSQKIIRKENNEYCFQIIILDGVENFSRAHPDFTIAVALQHITADKKYETIAMAINKIIGGELYYCEKGFGAYLNSRRLRVSKRNQSQQIIASNCLNFNQSQKNIPYNYGCNTLAIGYFASARLDQVVLNQNSSPYIKSFLLIAKEAGGKVEEKGDQIILTNL